MKLLLIPLLLAGAGAGWFGLRPEAVAADCPPPCDTEDCRVTVECTERGTCLVTCTDASGEIRCQQEVACEEDCAQECDEPCERPCEAPAKAAPASGCALPCAK